MAATYTNEEMYNATQEAIYTITTKMMQETGTAGRKKLRIELDQLNGQLKYWGMKVDKEAQTTAEKKPVVARFRTPS